ncbi:hypothetical protein [Kibdelosporangium aridum]|uniref:hypothetical protein n=1 Tax=Kibdelosporangium aridum TaxID=2030 RepID=UPI0035EC9915
MTVSAAPAEDLSVLSGLTEITRFAGVGTAVSDTSYSQSELLEILDVDDPKIRSVFLNSAIDRRFLTLPPESPGGGRISEPQGDLLDKHKKLAVDMGCRALEACLKSAGATLSDLRHLCCVTSTGFLTPGLSALIIRELGIDPHCSRSDIVGMGCNAGLNALNVVAGWSAAHPGRARRRPVQRGMFRRLRPGRHDADRGRQQPVRRRSRRTWRRLR